MPLTTIAIEFDPDAIDTASAADLCVGLASHCGPNLPRRALRRSSRRQSRHRGSKPPTPRKPPEPSAIVPASAPTVSATGTSPGAWPPSGITGSWPPGIPNSLPPSAFPGALQPFGLPPFNLPGAFSPFPQLPVFSKPPISKPLGFIGFLIIILALLFCSIARGCFKRRQMRAHQQDLTVLQRDGAAVEAVDEAIEQTRPLWLEGRLEEGSQLWGWGDIQPLSVIPLSPQSRLRRQISWTALSQKTPKSSTADEFHSPQSPSLKRRPSSNSLADDDSSPRCLSMRHRPSSNSLADDGSSPRYFSMNRLPSFNSLATFVHSESTSKCRLTLEEMGLTSIDRWPEWCGQSMLVNVALAMPVDPAGNQPVECVLGVTEVQCERMKKIATGSSRRMPAFEIYGN